MMTPIEKSALVVIAKLQTHINAASEKLPKDDTSKSVLAMGYAQTKWLECLITDAPLPEVMPDDATSKMVFERLAEYANLVNSGAYKCMIKAQGNDELLAKWKWVFTLSNYQWKWLDALRYNTPLPIDNVPAVS